MLTSLGRPRPILADARSSSSVALFWLGGFATMLVAALFVDLGKPFPTVFAEVALPALVPVAVCAVFAWIGARLPDGPVRNAVKYALFFLIAVTSLLGITKTMTGSHSASRTLWLYGLAFYTASLAHWLHVRGPRDVLGVICNPLMLATGPVVTRVRAITGHRVGARVRYYLPFVVVGLFLHQAVATPLTDTFFLISRTDALSALIFAAIFELFVYANFCGLSLLIYGLAGILGMRVPLNFRQPFSAGNMIEFWRGWHTSLSEVLKVLFYQPVRKRMGSTAALFAVYLCSAAWHGVTLNFAMWGAFHALAFIATMQLLKRKVPAVVPTLVMLAAVVVGRLLFLDADTDRLLMKLHFEFVPGAAVEVFKAISSPARTALMLAILFVGIEFLGQRAPHVRKRNYKFFRLPVVQLVLVVLLLITIQAESGVDYAVYGQR